MQFLKSIFARLLPIFAKRLSQHSFLCTFCDSIVIWAQFKLKFVNKYITVATFQKCFCTGTYQRPNSKKNMGPYAGVDYNLTLLYVDSSTCTMVKPMPESTLTLCQSRLYLPVRDFGFRLWVPVPM